MTEFAVHVYFLKVVSKNVVWLNSTVKLSKVGLSVKSPKFGSAAFPKYVSLAVDITTVEFQAFNRPNIKLR